MSRTKRKPFTGTKRFGKSCRNSGACDYCRGNRTHKNERRKPAEE